MKKLFKPLFTISLGILFFILTLTANSEAAKKEKKAYFCGYAGSSDRLPSIRPTPCKETASYWSISISPEQYVKEIIDHYGKKDVVIQSLYDDFEKYNLDLNIVRKIVKLEPTQTQIAKKEPTQTQQVAKKKEEKKNDLVKLSSDEKESLIEELIELTALYEEGVLTEEEFSQFKAKIIGLKKPSQTTKVASKKIFRIGNKKSATQSEEKCIPVEKSGFTKVDGKTKYLKKKYCIYTQDIAELGIYQEFNAYPEGMLKEFKNCKKFHCQSRIASKKMYEIFVRRGETYHARRPGKMIHGMAWFEIVYLAKHKKTMKMIERYVEYKQGNYNYSSQTKKRMDERQINSLIKMNKGRKNMRVAMGLSLEDDLAKVIRRHWLLGDFLGNDQLKAKKVSVNSAIKKRKELLTKYQAALKKYKTKLEEEKNKKDL